MDESCLNSSIIETMKNTHPKTVLISAYAVNPFKGSEDGTGWNISKEIAKEYNVVVITRKNNIPHIEAYIEQHQDPIHQNMRFIGYDLPSWLMKLKKRLGERGYVFYYYLWQYFLPAFIKKQKIEFDLAHALNFHSDSVPTFLWKLGKPTFWGPIGHHPSLRKDFVFKVYGRATYWKDQLYGALKWSLRNLDPNFNTAQRKVDRIFAINSAVKDAMPSSAYKMDIIPAVATVEPNQINENASEHPFRWLSVGRFHYMKGFDIVLKAFAEFLVTLSVEERQSAVLTLVGQGEEEELLKKLASDLRIDDNVEWINWVNKNQMEALYLSSKLFVFGSHEGAGMVIPEALSYGLPVICLDNAGPGELVGSAGIKIAVGSPRQVVSDFARAARRLYKEPDLYRAYSALAFSRYKNNFTWASKGAKIKSAYEKTLAPKEKSVAIFHPSSELYGADRILVNAINVFPEEVKKTVYLKFDGPLHDFIKSNTVNCEVIQVPFLPVIYRKIFTPVGVLKFSMEWLKTVRFMQKESATRGFSVAYVNTLSISPILPVLKMLRIPSFIHVHEILENPRVIAWLTAKTADLFAQKIICVSDAVRENLLKYAPNADKKTIVLHNGIEEVASDSKPSSPILDFYLFGRIMPKKGQWFLIDALSKIERDKLTNTHFTLMGGAVPGEEHSLRLLQEEIERLGLNDVVSIKPFAADISTAMSSADVCLVPSMMKDPFPTTVLEAMSAGRPVIATNHGGAKEAINGSNCGLLVDPANSNQLALQIEYFLDKPEEVKRMGQAAKMRYESAFTLQHFSDKWNSFLAEEQFI